MSLLTPPVADYAAACCPPADLSTVAGGRATVCLGDDGIVYVRMLPGTELDDTDARAIMAAVNAACAGRRRPLLVDLTGLGSVTPAARWVFSVPSRAAAQALFGASPVERVIASFFMTLNPMPCPTAFFARREAAREWLLAKDWGEDGGSAQAICRTSG